MSLQVEKLRIVWTVVPSGIHGQGANRSLRLRIVVAPRFTPDSVIDGSIDKFLFEDWPARLKAGVGVLRPFDVKIASGTGVTIAMKGATNFADLVAPGQWGDVLGTFEIREKHDLEAGDLPVDSRAASYDPQALEQHISNRRGADAFRASVAKVRHPIDIHDVSLQAAILFEQQAEMSALAWTRRPATESWAEIKLDSVARLAALPRDPRLDDERQRKLEERNLYRLAKRPQIELRADVIERVKALTKGGGASRAKSRPINDPASDEFLELALFHSRVRSLKRRAESKNERRPDFAQRLGLVRNYPQLARRLGLILEVRVTPSAADWNALKAGRWRVWVEPRWNGNGPSGDPIASLVQSVSPSTWSDFDNAQSRFVASEIEPDGRPDRNHSQGYLKLDPDEWQLTNCELDGSSIKLINEADSVVGRATPAFITDRQGTIQSLNEIAENLFSDGNDRTATSSSIHEHLEPIKANDPSLNQILESLFSEGLPQRSVRQKLKPKRDPGGLATADFRITLKTNPSGATMRCEWTMLLDNANDQPFAPIVGPAQRTMGIALSHRTSGERVAATVHRQVEIVNEGAMAPPPGEPRLAAADLILGYVPEIWAPPARNANGKKAWRSTTSRLERYPALGSQWHPGEGFISLGVSVTDDAAPADQENPERQGAVSPALFVYSNESLGVDVKRKTGRLPEEELSQGDPGMVELRAQSRTLPLVRYSHVSSEPFWYAVRCRYIDVAGHTYPRDPNVRDPNNGISIEGLIRRQEPVEPPRILTDGALNLNSNPAAGLKRMIVRGPGTSDERSLIPPRTTADQALRYGLILGDDLRRRGGFDAIDLDEYAEVPEVEVISSDAVESGTTPVRRRRQGTPREGFYYLPDPASFGVAIGVHTFYSLAYEQPPITRWIPFYGGAGRWPNARPIRIQLYSLNYGDIEPVVVVRGTTFQIGLPPAWTGRVEVTSYLHSTVGGFGPDHFAAIKDQIEYRARWTEVFDALLKYRAKTGISAAPTSKYEEVMRKRIDSPRATKQLVRLFSGLKSLFQETTSEQLTQFAAHGRNPVVTPPEVISLISAVSRPLYTPSLTVNADERDENADKIGLRLASVIDEKSTGEVTVSATWLRRQDDPQLGDPKVVRDYVPVSTLKLNEPVTYMPTTSRWQATIDLGTARHRRVEYSISGLTRFADCYRESIRERLMVESGTQVVLNHPNSARPAAVAPQFLVPTLTWSSHLTRQVERPYWKFDARAQYGIRVFFGRGWDLGELLGIVTRPTLSEHQAWAMNKHKHVVVMPETTVPEALRDSVSQWGADPLVESYIPRDLPAPTDFSGYKHVGGNLYLPPFDNMDGEPPKPDDRHGRRISVVGYQPIWDARRKLWYCDIGLNRIPSYGCFVRLVIARYQPISLEHLELSAPIGVDFIQVRPDRFVTVMREPGSPRSIRVTVSEPIGRTTPMATRPEIKGVKNSFYISSFNPCSTPSGTHAGWLSDDSIIVTPNETNPDTVLYNATVTWPYATRQRRLLVREIEEFSAGDRGAREIFSCVLEL